jgi:hypothetical protein
MNADFFHEPIEIENKARESWESPGKETHKNSPGRTQSAYQKSFREDPGKFLEKERLLLTFREI